MKRKAHPMLSADGQLTLEQYAQVLLGSNEFLFVD